MESFHQNQFEITNNKQLIHYTIKDFRSDVQQAGMPLTYLQDNIKYILGLTIYNRIRIHSSQHIIRIHCQVPNITRADVDSLSVSRVSNTALVIRKDSTTLIVLSGIRYYEDSSYASGTSNQDSIYQQQNKISGNLNQRIWRMYQQLGKLNGILLLRLRIYNVIQSLNVHSEILYNY